MLGLGGAESNYHLLAGLLFNGLYLYSEDLAFLGKSVSCHGKAQRKLIMFAVILATRKESGFYIYELAELPGCTFPCWFLHFLFVV